MSDRPEERAFRYIPRKYKFVQNKLAGALLGHDKTNHASLPFRKQNKALIPYRSEVRPLQCHSLVLMSRGREGEGGNCSVAKILGETSGGRGIYRAKSDRA